jgi:hypothetical protein
MTSKLGRRSFMKGAGLTGVGLVGAAIAGTRLGMLDKAPGAASLGIRSSSVEAAGFSDVDIFNFALNLEYLEAEFYTVATTGKTLEESGFDLKGTGKSGPTTGGKAVDFRGDRYWGWEVSGRLGAIAKEIAKDEQDHVLFLRSALGSDAIAKPTIDLAALGIGFDSFQQFLVLARAFEDTGVSAYGGAAPLISSKTNLGYAVQVGLTEALHSANLRLLVAENKVATTATDKYDVLPPPSGKQYFETSGDALAVIRTPGEVLSIVFGNSAPNISKGGFFPYGVNGYFTTT